MISSTDLYPILVFYANKNNSPYIAVDSFLDFLGKTAKKYCIPYPAWNRWLQDIEAKFWAEIPALVQEGKCEFISEADNSHLFIPNYYPELVNEAYQDADQDADAPFPSEASIGIILPANQMKHASSESDFLSALNTQENSSSRIVKIIFPDDFGSALVLTDMIPRQLAETALLKVRNYLKRYGNREYVFHKLHVPLQGREDFLKKQMEHIVMRPLDVYNDIKEGRELSYIFWGHFCALVKHDIRKKQEHLPIDIAAFQSFSVIEAINGYYRSIAVKQLEIELAFRTLEGCLAKPPYTYSMTDIIRFTDSKGKLLLSIYTNEELETWLKKQTTESKDKELPPLQIFKSTAANDNFFILKDKLLPFSGRLLIDARLLVNDVILKQWARLLMEYKTEPAMKDDDEFEKMLYKTCKKLCPDLMTLLADARFALAYFEMENKPSGIPPSLAIFNKGVLLPYPTLFNVKRRDMLENAKSVLPFWYSMPILVAIVSFFKGLFKKRNNVKTLLAKENGGEEDIFEETPKTNDIKAAAFELELHLIPAGHTLDSYLAELEDRWSRLIDRKARENLINDVKFLARDNLRRVLKIQKHFKPTQETLSELAANLVSRNKALSSLSARDSLLLYLELYMIKLLGNVK